MMHCPICGSERVECQDTVKSHRHVCFDCGYETVAAPLRAKPVTNR